MEKQFNKFILGTKSELKVSALKEAISEIFENESDYTIYSYNVKSEQPEQPFEEEGIKGAYQRANNAAKEFRETNSDMSNAVVIGIENYIRRNNNRYEDLAAICLIKLDSNIDRMYYSESVIFEDIYVAECLKTGETVGNIMQRNGIVNKHDDPHIDLIGKSRKRILKESLKKAILNFKNIK